MIVRRWLNALEKEHYIVYRKNAYALTYYGSNLVSENENIGKNSKVLRMKLITVPLCSIIKRFKRSIIRTNSRKGK